MNEKVLKSKLKNIITSNTKAESLIVSQRKATVKLTVDFRGIKEGIKRKEIKGLEGKAITTLIVEEIEVRSYDRNINYSWVVHLPKELTATLNSFSFSFSPTDEKLRLEDDKIGITITLRCVFDDSTTIGPIKEIISTTLESRAFWPVISPKDYASISAEIDDEGIIRTNNKLLLYIRNDSTIQEGKVTEETLIVKCYKDEKYDEKAPITFKVKKLIRLDAQDNILHPQEEGKFEITLAVEEIKKELLKANNLKLYLITYTITFIDERIDYIVSRAQQYTLILTHISERFIRKQYEKYEEYEKIGIDQSFDASTTIKRYVTKLSRETSEFFEKLRELKEPLIEGRTVRRYKRPEERIELKKEEDRWSEPEPWEKVLEEDRPVVIEGPMGVGKTVLSYQIIKKIIEKGECNKGIIPVRLEGKSLSLPEENAKYYTLLDLICAEIINKNIKELEISTDEKKEKYIKALKKYFKPNHYRFYLIIDGHDEIIQQQDNNTLTSKVEQQLDNTLTPKIWLTQELKEKAENINVIVIGRRWSIETSFMSLRAEGKVAYYKLAELTDEQVKNYTAHFLKNYGYTDNIEKRLKLYKKHYSNLYHRPLFLRLLCLKSLNELSKPLDVFTLLKELNQQVLFWIVSKYLPDILVEGKHLLQEHDNLQLLAKNNPKDFLNIVANKKVRWLEGSDVTFNVLLGYLNDFMAELTNELLFEPLARKSPPLSYLNHEDFYSVLNSERFKILKPFIELLLNDGNYWLNRHTSSEYGSYIDRYFFSVYKMFEYFTTLYTYNCLLRSDPHPLSILLGNSYYCRGILELISSPIANELLSSSNSSHFIPVLDLALSSALPKDEYNTLISTLSVFLANLNLSFSHDILTFTHCLVDVRNRIFISTLFYSVYSINLSSDAFSLDALNHFLTNIPKFKELKELNLRGANLSSLPESIGGLKELKTLNLRGANLSSLPESIGELKKLEKLNLSSFLDPLPLSSLPESIGELKELKELDLMGTSLSSLPESIGELEKLERLYLSRTNLSSLPESIGKLKELKELYLSFTPLSSLPESIGKLEKLEYLNLSFTSLSSLPESIGELKELKRLNLRQTKLSSLPESIGKLKKLKELYLSGTKLSSLPESIAKLEKLEKLELGGSPFFDLPSLFESIKLELKELKLWKTNLSSLPKNIGELKELKELNLAGTPLSSLPESIGKLEKLEYLNLSFTNLSSLPESIGELKELKKLILRNTKLSSLPESITKLEKLEVLDLSRTNLSSLPENIGELKELKKLKLSYTNLSSLPENIGELKELKELNLSCTNLSSLPESIVYLPNLRVLYVSKEQYINTDKKILLTLKRKDVTLSHY